MGFMNLLNAMAGHNTPAVILGGQDVNSDLDNILAGNTPAPPPPIAPQAPLYPAQAEADPGMLQEPAVQDMMRQNLYRTLQGLSPSLAQPLDPEDARRTDRLNRDDALRANLLAPLMGFSKGHLKDAIQASKDYRSAIDKRNEDRRSHANDRMSLFKSLAGVIKDADPNDFDNVLKQQKEQRQTDAEARRAKSAKERQENWQKQFDFRQSESKRVQGNYEKTLKNTIYNQKLNHEERAKARGIAEAGLNLRKQQLELQRQSLEQRIANAADREDWEYVDHLRQQAQDIDNEDVTLTKMYESAIDSADKAEAAAAKENGEEAPKPKTAEEKMKQAKAMAAQHKQENPRQQVVLPDHVSSRIKAAGGREALIKALKAKGVLK